MERIVPRFSHVQSIIEFFYKKMKGENSFKLDQHIKKYFVRISRNLGHFRDSLVSVKKAVRMSKRLLDPFDKHINSLVTYSAFERLDHIFTRYCLNHLKLKPLLMKCAPELCVSRLEAAFTNIMEKYLKTNRF